MFHLENLVNRWRRPNEKRYRLVPLDWWAEDEGPLNFEPPVIVGRSERATLRLIDPWISRLHCELLERDGRLLVRDLESRHGVFVNGQRVSQMELQSGDVLHLGVSQFRVEYIPASDIPAPAQPPLDKKEAV